MAGVAKKSFSQPEEVRNAGSGRGDIVEIAGVKFLRMTLPPGWKWSKDVKPLAGTDTCQAKHVGTMISGRMVVRHNDGSEQEFGPGDLYEIQPGHDAWIVGDVEAVGLDVTGSENWAKQ